VLFGHGPDPQRLHAALHALHAEVTGRRAEWAVPLLAPGAAVEQALVLAASARGPVLIADTQDNPGAGGDANTTGLLHALLAARAGRRLEGAVALGLMFDPPAAAAACAAGVGARPTLSIGRSVPTWSGEPSDPPVKAEVRVLAVHDGALDLHGPMTAGLHARLGPCACIEIEGVRVLLASARMQMLDLDLFRFLGVEPARMKLLVLKSSVHFRAAFAPVAGPILIAKAPGPMAADPGELPWTKLDPRTATRP
jgi:microcystin degradation protein MlrC